MKQDINIAELLKDCPKGTKLYSPIFGECELQEVDNHGKGTIYVIKENRAARSFTYDGKYYIEGECLLFPSKEVRDWGCFRAKYVHLTDNLERNKSLLALLGDKFEQENMELTSSYFIAYKDAVSGIIKSHHLGEYASEYILSTGTELKLEEKQSKFKVGDVVMINGFVHILAQDSANFPPCKFSNPRYAEYSIGACMDWANDKDTRLAPPEEIDKWNEEVLQPNHLHYSKSKRKIIHWFKEFDKVIVSLNVDSESRIPWRPCYFAYYCKDLKKYTMIDGFYYEYCIPYNEKTAKLIGTTDDYEEE